MQSMNAKMTNANSTPTNQGWAAQDTSVGHFQVRRALPSTHSASVGPFVFLDHFGPAPAKPGTLPAHPHAGIEVMTYLLEGSNAHIDSMGHHGVVRAGGVQWMSAGSGVLHAETVIAEPGDVVHGLQLWTRLPLDQEDLTPKYKAFDSSSIPAWEQDGVTTRLLAGSFEGRNGPIPIATESLLLHVEMNPESEKSLGLPDPNHQYAIYVIWSEGESLLVNGQPSTIGWLTPSTPGAEFVYLVNLSQSVKANVLVLGGQSVTESLQFGGPFVYDSQDKIQAAWRRFKHGEMGTLNGVPF